MRTYSQVLSVFFFGVGLMVLQMEVDCLRNFHGTPPVVGIVGYKCHDSSVPQGAAYLQEWDNRLRKHL